MLRLTGARTGDIDLRAGNVELRLVPEYEADVLDTQQVFPPSEGGRDRRVKFCKIHVEGRVLAPWIGARLANLEPDVAARCPRIDILPLGHTRQVEDVWSRMIYFLTGREAKEGASGHRLHARSEAAWLLVTPHGVGIYVH